MKPYIALAALAALVPGAMAQQRSIPAGPGDPALSVPPVKYESPFAGYVPYREEKLASWREVNDKVGKERGHVGIFGGAGHAGQGAEKTGPAKPAEPTGQAPVRGAPNAAPSGGHGTLK